MRCVWIHPSKVGKLQFKPEVQARSIRLEVPARSTSQKYQTESPFRQWSIHVVTATNFREVPLP